MIYFIKTDEFGDIVVRDNGDGSVTFIPMTEGNSDYAAYQEWLAEGNTPEPWPPAES